MYAILPIGDLTARREGDHRPQYPLSTRETPWGCHRPVGSMHDRLSALKSSKINCNRRRGPQCPCPAYAHFEIESSPMHGKTNAGTSPVCSKISNLLPKTGGQDCSFVVPSRSWLDQEPAISIAGGLPLCAIEQQGAKLAPS